ncbi:MAG: hypothetical protein Q8M29_01480 [Bacteroidota bacterium]|nr:hypothetical protein [Bacteroidota bacterium]
MKKYSLIIAVILGTACKGPQADESLIQQRDSLMMVIDERETTVNEFMISFNEVESNLSAISAKQNTILLNADKEMKADQKERINDEIKAINELMEANARKLKQLDGKLVKSDKKNAQLAKTISMLNDQLTQKFEELKAVNERLDNLNLHVAQLQVCVDSLYVVNEDQSQTITETVTELHTAYYVVGDAKELRKQGFIDKEGGLLGIGRTSKLSDDFDYSKFVKIDYTQTTNIYINGKNAKVITTHPEDSYTLNKTGKVVDNITITNPEKFWSASKYLVITK